MRMPGTRHADPARRAWWIGFWRGLTHPFTSTTPTEVRAILRAAERDTRN